MRKKVLILYEKKEVTAYGEIIVPREILPVAIRLLVRWDLPVEIYYIGGEGNCAPPEVDWEETYLLRWQERGVSLEYPPGDHIGLITIVPDESGRGNGGLRFRVESEDSLSWLYLDHHLLCINGGVPDKLGGKIIIKN